MYFKIKKANDMYINGILLYWNAPFLINRV